MFIFDCHVHLPSPGLRETWEWEPFTPDIPSALAYLHRCGVDKIIANSMRGEIAHSIQEMIEGNNEIAQAAHNYPDMIIPACLINTNFEAESLHELERCRKELNILWVGELCGYAGGYTYDTQAFGKAVRLATKLNMVLHIHNDDFADMDRLCHEFPQTTFILAHLGESPDDVKQRIILTEKHPNLYLDICGNGFERMGILEYAVKIAGPERVLFGSDYTINDPSGVIARIMNSYFDDETKKKILGGNLTRLLAERGIQLPEI